MASDTSTDSGAETGWKIFATLSAIGGSMVGRKVLRKAWVGITGTEPPANPEHPDVEWREAVTWAVVSGVVVALFRLVAQRQAARTWYKARGARPPGLEDVS
jgi:hypothetical protein